MNRELLADKERARYQNASAEKKARIIARNRASYIKRKYDLTVEQYDAMWRAQEGLCKLCRRPLGEGRLIAIDHNHTTGAVRGILHLKCNAGLGQFEDSVELLRMAISYLEKSQ